jgi:predicted Kef-type K+ transport protein
MSHVVVSDHAQVKRLTGPIRDLFAVFFFASLGKYQMKLICISTAIADCVCDSAC